MTASKEVFDLRGNSYQRLLTLEDVIPLRSVFALSNRYAVRVLLPTRADVVAMTEQTLVAVDKVRDGLSGMTGPPRSSVDRLLRRRAATRVLTRLHLRNK